VVTNTLSVVSVQPITKMKNMSLALSVEVCNHCVPYVFISSIGCVALWDPYCLAHVHQTTAMFRYCRCTVVWLLVIYLTI
jgi:hypothetical protein